MKITERVDGDQLVMELDGRLDTMSAPDLESELESCLKDVKELIFDFSKIEYVSSAGLRVLLHAQKMMHNKGTVKIINTNQLAKEVFSVTGFDSIMDVE